MAYSFYGPNGKHLKFGSEGDAMLTVQVLDAKEGLVFLSKDIVNIHVSTSCPLIF